jgi:NAD kinase
VSLTTLTNYPNCITLLHYTLHHSNRGVGAAQQFSAADDSNSKRPYASDGVDFVLTLGGDGLLMHSSTLFREAVPPHLCFNLGSMGFLTPFELEQLKAEVINTAYNYYIWYARYCYHH